MIVPSVLVLDSGVGGLSITGEILTRCPALHIDYIADLAAFPYGTKPEMQIVERITQLIEHASGTLRPAVIVIACNTASTVALTAARKITAIPVVGVVPAIKPAAKLSKTGVIGILATEGTVNRTYTHNLIKEFARDSTVVLHGSARLVELAEEKLQHGSVNPRLVRQELLPLFTHNPHMDTVVLACTHFPLLKDEFMQNFPEIRFWVDSGSAIASRVESLLNAQGLDIANVNSALQLNTFFVTSSQTRYTQASLERYLGRFREDFIFVV